MIYKNLREEEIKNKVAQDYFSIFDCTKIIGNIDFCVTLPQKESKTQSYLFDTESLLWAEAKKGQSDIYESFVQLILTIGKARTFDKSLPPAFLGAFDAEKIAFIPYNEIHDIFYLNDFNWNVAPSNHESKEFLQVYQKVKTTLEKTSLLFSFEQDKPELDEFIKVNFILGKSSTSKIQIDKNNFMVIYNKWLNAVKPTIAIDWDIAKKNGIIDGDFYLADLLSHENQSIKEKLYVLLKVNHYELDKKIDDIGLFSTKTASFNDKQKAHTQFWNKYQRPPKEEYWNYIVERRDLLVPQDVRERKGSFYTPQIWVELSQKYIADVLGENWQDEYYVWDCAAGTGNLLNGLTNKYNIWASTLDQQDVDVMHDRIDVMNQKSLNGKGASLLHDHVFQFDFLNDDFSKLPKPLQEIINHPEKRKKLVMYINPPYAESNGRINTTRSEIQNTKIHSKYFSKMEKVAAELFAQFLIRIYIEIPDCFIAQFSTLKVISAPNSKIFRDNFLAKNEKTFIVPASTFDNVKGKFPIGFFVWNTQIKEKIDKISSAIFEANKKFIGYKNVYSYDNEKGKINDWLNLSNAKENGFIGVLVADAPDFQNNNFIAIQNIKGDRHGKYFWVNKNNLRIAFIYFSVRHSIKATWLNDRDQFLYPNEGWQTDAEFQNDCLAYSLFHGQNKISSKEGINHWIPFTEHEVNSREKFESSFMADFIAGKIKPEKEKTIFSVVEEPEAMYESPLHFSPEAKAVFDAGRELWKYYHQQPKVNVNASLYDIREYFQERNDKGKMNNKSTDEIYTQLIKLLREQIQSLENKLQPKVYQYGFLKE